MDPLIILAYPVSVGSFAGTTDKHSPAISLSTTSSGHFVGFWSGDSLNEEKRVSQVVHFVSQSDVTDSPIQRKMVSSVNKQGKTEPLTSGTRFNQ